MSKLQNFISSAMVDDSNEYDKTNMTHYNKVLSQITINDNNEYMYQGIHLMRCNEFKRIVPAA